MYYYPNGAVKQFSYGNGIAHTLEQYVRGLPKLSQDGSVLKDLYTYDNNANVASIADQAESVTTRSMEYHGLNRLKHVSAPALWGDAWYGYDALDNLTSSQVTAGAKARTLTHNYINNRLDNVTGSYTLGYQYDSQGNIILRGGQSYSFDIGNRMRSAPGITTHAYDGLGRRTSVVGTDGINHIYVYGQEGKLLYETTTGQALASGTKYVYLNRHLVAEVSGGGVVYDHTDGLGSPVAKTSSTAGLISRTRYEPYGATAAGTEPTIGFTGHLNAANLGLVDMQQRFYDPVAGRFLSIGPVVTDAGTGGGFNRYAYANNSPYKYVDPDGRDSCVAQSGGGQTCTYTVNTTVGGAAAMTVGAGIWNTGVAIYNHAATKDKSESGSAASAKVAEKAVERKDAYVVRVQAQGTTLKNETSVPIVGSTPIKAEAVQYALGVTAAGLTSKEQAKMAPAFNKASDWVNAVAASGGIGPEGARSQTFRVPGNTPGEARVDVEVIKGHNIVQ